MARSQYVYWIYDSFSEESIAYFTVKHEALSCLNRLNAGSYANGQLQLWRARDGESGLFRSNRIEGV